MMLLVFYILERMNTKALQSHPREGKRIYFVLHSVAYSYKNFFGFFFFQLCSYLIMKVSIHLCGRNRGNSVLRWHLSVMRTKMRERHHLGLVLNLFLHTWCFSLSLTSTCNLSLFLTLVMGFTLLNKSSHQFRVPDRMKHYGLNLFVVFAFSLGIIWPDHFQQSTRKELKLIHSNVGPNCDFT